MARNIQAISGRGRGQLGAFLRALGSAALWIGVALVFPFRAIPELLPALAPYAPWIPYAFYLLALWSVVAAARSLGRLVNSWLPQQAARQGPGRQSRGKPAAGNRAAAPIAHRPTVQRMR